MVPCGLLLFASHRRLASVLSAAGKHVSRILYASFNPESHQSRPWPRSEASLDRTPDRSRFLAGFYGSADQSCRHLDVRLLLSGLKGIVPKQPHEIPPVGIVLAESGHSFENLHLPSSLPTVKLGDCDGESNVENGTEIEDGNVVSDWKTYDHVVMGGTFDRLHNGHKIFLSEAVLVCRQRLTIGITTGNMLKSKVLWELIEPVETRMKKLREFLESVDSGLTYEIVPIIDAFGPSTVDPTLQCIVVSQETFKGGNRVNEEREKKGLSKLAMHVVNLAPDESSNDLKEDKISSSTTRISLLGEKIRDTQWTYPVNPLRIGLTGGIASGKSTIAKCLEEFGAAVINCDKLGHSVYKKGMPAYQKILHEFGMHVVGSDGEVDRKLLAAEVFSSADRLQRLNAIVWPEVKKLAEEKIHKYALDGIRVVVIEAALLLEAGWEDMAHEVWVTILPSEEALRRVQNRDQLNLEQASRRVSAQSSNLEKIAKAHVVFCTMWEPNFTRVQVEKAWRRLEQMMQEGEKT